MMKCKKIHEFHKILNVKAKKYSDIFKNLSAEKSSDWIKSYVIYVLILHVCKDTFDKEQTVLIATYTLKHSGLNDAVASIKDIFNQMIQGSLTIGNGHSQASFLQ